MARHAALQHQNSFDVCWCRGSVAEKIFAPLIGRIRARGGSVTGSRLVERLDVDADGLVNKVVARCVLRVLCALCVCW